MSTKITALPASPALALTSIFPVVQDPSGVPVTQRADFSQLQTLLATGGPFVLKAGDTMTGALSIGNGTVVVSTPTLNLTQTWNAGAVTFTNLFSNVTNTASSTNSNLFNFQVGASDRFNFTVGGVFRAIKEDATDSGLSVFLRKRGAVGDATAAVAANSLTYSISSSGWDGSAFQTGAQILSRVEGTWSGANRGNTIEFTAVPTGATAAINMLFLNGAFGVLVKTSLTVPYVSKVATYTATALDHTIDCVGTFTINLPTAVGITGRLYSIKNSGVGTITIDPSGAELIDGLATSPVVSGAAALIQSTGTGWIII